MKTRPLLLALAALSGALGATLSGHAAGWFAPALPETRGSLPAGIEALEEAFVGTVERVLPSVVSVTAFSPGRRGRMSLGSGVILDEEGHVLTNNHVVAAGSSWRVTLPDGRRLRALLVGRDPASDLAVLSIEAENLEPARLGDSDRVRVGQWVLALGTPHELPRTVTAGIISAKGRTNVGVASYENYLQTDAAINQGNSGGPLVDLRGRVVGINTAILSPPGGSQGISFAIPINMARGVAAQLIQHGRVRRAWLGVYMEDLPAGRREEVGLQAGKGVLITRVVEGGPAARAGVRPGDVVLSMQNAPLGNRDLFRLRISERKPGETIVLGIWRDGRMMRISVPLGEKSGDE